MKVVLTTARPLLETGAFIGQPWNIRLAAEALEASLEFQKLKQCKTVKLNASSKVEPSIEWYCRSKNNYPAHFQFKYLRHMEIIT